MVEKCYDGLRPVNFNRSAGRIFGNALGLAPDVVMDFGPNQKKLIKRNFVGYCDRNSPLLSI
jgi:hypothetical protein